MVSAATYFVESAYGGRGELRAGAMASWVVHKAPLGQDISSASSTNTERRGGKWHN